MEGFCFIILCLIGYLSTGVEAEAISKYVLKDTQTRHLYMDENNQTLIVISETVCALECYHASCVGYTLEDGSCFIRGINGLNNTQDINNPDKELVFIELVDFARDKKTDSTDHYPDRIDEFVVDNITCRNDEYCCLKAYAHTNPWFRVDLGEPKMIHMIDIAGCLPIRFHGPIEVRIGISGLRQDYDLVYLIDESTREVEERHLISFPEPVVGRYVTLTQISVKKNLVLGEVRVLGVE